MEYYVNNLGENFDTQWCTPSTTAFLKWTCKSAVFLFWKCFITFRDIKMRTLSWLAIGIEPVLTAWMSKLALIYYCGKPVNHFRFQEGNIQYEYDQDISQVFQEMLSKKIVRFHPAQEWKSRRNVLAKPVYHFRFQEGNIQYKYHRDISQVFQEMFEQKVCQLSSTERIKDMISCNIHIIKQINSTIHQLFETVNIHQ